MLMRHPAPQRIFRPPARQSLRYAGSVTLLGILYFPLTCWIAQRKPIWTDELFTLYLARLPNASTLWRALETGADQHPPLFYGIIHMSLALFGESELALRLPCILAFWVMCICLGAFVARRTDAASGYLAAVLPLVLGIFGYAYEARGYALVLGFASIALLGWQRARDRRVRPAALLAIAVGLAGAVGCHYYAILILAPLAVAELVRSVPTRRIDWLVWVAGAAALIPLAIFYPVIRQAAGFSNHFWAKPSLRYFVIYFNDYVGWSGVTPLVVAVAVIGLYMIPIRNGVISLPSFLLRERLGTRNRAGPSGGYGSGGGRNADRQPGVPASEVALSIGLLTIQLIALLLAVFVTGAFHPRYAIATCLGGPILFGLATHTLASQFRLLRTVLIFGLTAWFVVLAMDQVNSQGTARHALDREHDWLARQAPSKLPLVISNSEVWYKVCYYGDPALRQRCFYLADPDASVRFLGHDTVDRCGLALRPWFGAKMDRYQPFVQQQRQFLLYTDLNPQWNWLPSKLLADGARIEILARRRHRILARVTFPAQPGEAVAVSTTQGDEGQEHEP